MEIKNLEELKNLLNMTAKPMTEDKKQETLTKDEIEEMIDDKIDDLDFIKEDDLDSRIEDQISTYIDGEDFVKQDDILNLASDDDIEELQKQIFELRAMIKTLTEDKKVKKK